MSSQNGTYTAFYVAEPLTPDTLDAHATKGYYNMLRVWLLLSLELGIVVQLKTEAV